MTFPFATAVLLLAISLPFQMTLATSISGQGQSAGSRITIPLRQNCDDEDNLAAQALRAASKHAANYVSHLATEREYADGGFWYGSFTVGQAQNLSLLIDTGSQDLAINANLYQPTNNSKNMHRNGSLLYLTTQANGCGSANISYNVYTDSIEMAGLTSHRQTFAKVVPKKPSEDGERTDFPHDGLVGFSGVEPNQTQLKGMPFFQNLCNQGQLAECRFGMALGTEGKGRQVIGGIDSDLFDGNLSSAPLWQGKEWIVEADIVANGSTVLQNELMFLDSGTANIVGPTSSVRELFAKLGIQAVEQHLPGCASVLFGYYPCHSPPQVGFRIGGNDSPSFNISPSAFRQKAHDGDNCTATITGIDFHLSGGPLWIIGQPWFQGKYIDFDVDTRCIGVATLKGDSGCRTTADT